MLDTSRARSLISRLRAARAETDAQFDIVKPEFLFERPVSERHRLAFYIGHLEAFDGNLLNDAFGIKSPHPDLDRLFAFGIDPVDGELPNDQPSDWPNVRDIRRYRDGVRERIDNALASNDSAQLDQRLNVAIEHRQMHAETLSYLIHQLPMTMKRGESARPNARTHSLDVTTVRIPAGITALGLDATSGRFGWDNEFGSQRVDVPAFAIDKFKITNEQFLRFVDAGGYERREFWNDADWAWRIEHTIAHPVFWRRDGDAWFWRGMFDWIELPRDWPVYVSHAEASAYALWARRALPTEAQWQRAAFAENDRFDDAIHGEAARRFEPHAVDAENLSRSPFGVVGMLSNGWEWTSTVFGPFEGFRIFDFYPGYSQPFFDGKHFVLKGGSVRTAPSMLRPSFRNWFQAHYPYVYAGFRCVDAV